VSEKLILITANYPFTHNGGEVSFIAPEMQRLSREFGAVTVVPQAVSGASLDVPEGTVVDVSLAEQIARESWLGFLLAPLWPGFWREIHRALRSGGFVGCARVIKWAARAQIVWRWLEKFDPEAARRSKSGSAPHVQPGLVRGQARGHPPAILPGRERRLYYTYWRGGATMACARLAKAALGRSAVTRVHGYDLYEDRFDPPFQPWTSVYHELSLVVTISAHGRDYLATRGVPATSLHLARLGTEKAPGRSPASTDGAVRLASCSFLVSLKRVPRLAEAVCEFAGRHADRQVHWTHFGEGPDRESVRAVLQRKPMNLTVDMPGHLDNGKVLAHYAEQPVDAFLLLSESEGLPVSIQEAVSAGIPVIATDVGGVSEIVGSDNGLLIPPSADVNDVADALDIVIGPTGSPARKDLRDASLRRWADGFDAEANHSEFARLLKRLLHSS
jgi:glycosyltransferase involved in cell wall biosynthesis